MGEIIVGSEGLAAGAVGRYELTSRFTRVMPDVYAPKHLSLSLENRAEAAWLWSRRQGVVAGAAAAKLHGVPWIDDCEPVELVWTNRRAPDGVITRADLLLPSETEVVAGLPITTAVRTAFDLARCKPLRPAVARVDGLMRFAKVTVDDILHLAARHPGARNLRKLDDVLAVADRGAESPRETYLRLMINEADFPPLQTQICVPRSDGFSSYFLDMGWEDPQIAVEYDGIKDHFKNLAKVADDIEKREYCQRQGWFIIVVIARDHRASILRRIRAAFELRTR